MTGPPSLILTDLVCDCVGMEWDVRLELEQEIHRSTVHLNNLVPLLAACEVPDALALYISIARCSQN